jgi:hypothetical protein
MKTKIDEQTGDGHMQGHCGLASGIFEKVVA